MLVALQHTQEQGLLSSLNPIFYLYLWTKWKGMRVGGGAHHLELCYNTRDRKEVINVKRFKKRKKSCKKKMTTN